MPLAYLLPLVIAVILVSGLGRRVAAGTTDRARISQHIRTNGGSVQNCAWHPYFRGILGRRRERMYNVLYTDSVGALHEATFRTGKRTGVTLVEDVVVEAFPEGILAVQDLPAENSPEKSAN